MYIQKTVYHSTGQRPLLALARAEFIGKTTLDGLLILERAHGNLKVAYRSTGQWLLLALARAEFV